MRVYIIGNDGITLCRKAPATVGGRVTGKRLSWASLLYLPFAGALLLH